MWIAYIGVGVVMSVVGVFGLFRRVRYGMTAVPTHSPVHRSDSLVRSVLAGCAVGGVLLVVVGLRLPRAPYVAEPSSPVAATQATGSSQKMSASDEYRASIVETNNAIGRQLDGLTDHLIDARYDDEKWVAETLSILADMSETADDARSMAPPGEYSASHETWIQGIDAYDWAADNMRPAIEGPDFDLMNQCSDHLVQASAKFKQATNMMQEVR